MVTLILKKIVFKQELSNKFEYFYCVNKFWKNISIK